MYSSVISYITLIEPLEQIHYDYIFTGVTCNPLQRNLSKADFGFGAASTPPQVCVREAQCAEMPRMFDLYGGQSRKTEEYYITIQLLLHHGSG